MGNTLARDSKSRIGPLLSPVIFAIRMGERRRLRTRLSRLPTHSITYRAEVAESPSTESRVPSFLVLVEFGIKRMLVPFCAVRILTMPEAWSLEHSTATT